MEDGAGDAERRLLRMCALSRVAGGRAPPPLGSCRVVRTAVSCVSRALAAAVLLKALV